MGILQIIATGIVFLGIGLVCLFWTRDIQKWAVEWYERLEGAGFARSGLRRSYIESELYIWVTRFFGPGSLGLSLAMLVKLFRILGM